MVTERTRLVGGRLVDPSQGIDELADVVVGSGRVLEIVRASEKKRSSSAPSEDKVLDVSELIQRLMCATYISIIVRMQPSSARCSPLSRARYRKRVCPALVFLC